MQRLAFILFGSPLCSFQPTLVASVASDALGSQSISARMRSWSAFFWARISSLAFSLIHYNSSKVFFACRSLHDAACHSQSSALSRNRSARDSIVLNSSSQTDLDQRPALKGAARPYRHCLICDGLETRSTGVNFLYFVGLAADFDGTIANHGFVNVDAAT
jgi:hypothetical protein